MRNLKSHSLLPTASHIQLWRRELSRVQDKFIKAVAQDTGRNEAESYLYDWMPVESSLAYLKDVIEGFAQPRDLKSGLPSILGRRNLVERRIPLGTVLIVGTWNFPLSLHLSQILFSLAAGNKVVFKPSPFTPETNKVFSEELTRIFGEERFSTWTLSDAECVEAVKAGQFEGLIFTGGTEAAKIYARAASESFTKCILEASGSEVALLHSSAANPGADTYKNLVDHLLWALLHFNGQTCVAPRFWLIPENQIESVWSELKRALSHPKSEESFASRAPLRHEGVAKEFALWTEWAESLEQAEVYRPRQGHPAFFAKINSLKAVDASTPPSFGPGALLVGYEKFEEAVDWIRRSPWSLMTQFYGDNFSSMEWQKLQQLETSIVSMGESIVGVGDPAIPFGGRGFSGLGVTHGLEGLMELSRTQVFMEAKTWPLTSEWIRPRWSNLGQLKDLVPLMKKLRTDPVEGIKNFFEKRS